MIGVLPSSPFRHRVFVPAESGDAQASRANQGIQRAPRACAPRSRCPDQALSCPRRPLRSAVPCRSAGRHSQASRRLVEFGGAGVRGGWRAIKGNSSTRYALYLGERARCCRHREAIDAEGRNGRVACGITSSTRRALLVRTCASGGETSYFGLDQAESQALPGHRSQQAIDAWRSVASSLAKARPGVHRGAGRRCRRPGSSTWRSRRVGSARVLEDARVLDVAFAGPGRQRRRPRRAHSRSQDRNAVLLLEVARVCTVVPAPR